MNVTPLLGSYEPGDAGQRRGSQCTWLFSATKLRFFFMGTRRQVPFEVGCSSHDREQCGHGLQCFKQPEKGSLPRLIAITHSRGRHACSHASQAHPAASVLQEHMRRETKFGQTFICWCSEEGQSTRQQHHECNGSVQTDGCATDTGVTKNWDVRESN